MHTSTLKHYPSLLMKCEQFQICEHLVVEDSRDAILINHKIVKKTSKPQQITSNQSGTGSITSTQYQIVASCT